MIIKRYVIIGNHYTKYSLWIKTHPSLAGTNQHKPGQERDHNRWATELYKWVGKKSNTERYCTIILMSKYGVMTLSLSVFPCWRTLVQNTFNKQGVEMSKGSFLHWTQELMLAKFVSTGCLAGEGELWCQIWGSLRRLWVLLGDNHISGLEQPSTTGLALSR